MEAAAEEGDGQGGVHHSTTALINFGTTRYCVFRVTIPRWDQYLAHPSYRHCKSYQGSPGFASPAKREARSCTSHSGGRGIHVCSSSRKRHCRKGHQKKRLLSSLSVSRESFTTRKLVLLETSWADKLPLYSAEMKQKYDDA